MGIWDTIANAEAPGQGGVYFRRGDYLGTVTSIKMIKSQQHGGDIFIGETSVDEVVLGYEDSNKTGETCSTVADFQKRPKMAASDAKGFIAAALGCSPNDLTSALIQQAIENPEVVIGAQVKVHCFRKPVKSRPGSTIDVARFSPADDDE